MITIPLFNRCLSLSILVSLPIFQAAAQSGIFYTPAEVDVWRIRAESGPFKTDGDAFDPLIPGEWERIVKQKDVFMANPGKDRKESIVLNSGGNDAVILNHRDLMSAAFFSLVKEDTAIARTVVDELVWHAENAPRIEPDDHLSTDKGAWWVSAWFQRLAVAADFVRAEFTLEEFQQVKDWLSDWAHMDENSINQEISGSLNVSSSGLFPDRVDRNYDPYPVGHEKYKSRSDPNLYDAEDPFKSAPELRFVQSDPTNEQHAEYAYQDSEGVKHNPIYAAQRVYNNRKAVRIQNFAVIGALIDSDFLLDRAKLYVEEWLKFSVFPDGSTGEYERNEFSRNVQQGFTYNAHNLVTAVMVADILARRGDNSLYEFTTKEGRLGTECPEGVPAKSIKMAVMTQLDLIDGRKQWYIDVGDPTNIMHRIDPTSELDSSQQVRDTPHQWISDITFAPMGNAYWKDERIREVYTRKSVGSRGYCAEGCLNVQPPGPYWDRRYAYGPWQGMNYCSPSTLFMSAEMEDVVEYPIQGPVSMLEQSVPEGALTRFYAATFHALAGERPYTWQVTSGGLPEGLTLEPWSGRLKGYPRTEGTYPLTIRVTDNSGASAEMGYVLVINSEIPSGLVASYSFDKSDDVGFDGYANNHATAVNISPGPIGQVNQGLAFNGDAEQKLELPLLGIDNSATFSLWLKIVTLSGSGYQKVFSVGNDPATNAPIQVYLVEDRQRSAQRSHLVTHVDGQTEQGPLPELLTSESLDMSPYLNDNSWHHYVLTVDTESLSIYWDGARVTTIGNLDTSGLDLGEMIQFSGQSDLGAAGYDNQLDEVLIFNRSLDPFEVNRLYQSAISRAPWAGNMGWKILNQFGWLYDFEFPWVLSLEHGWIFCQLDWEQAFWFSIPGEDWFWTTTEIYPLAYSYSQSGWMVF